MTVTTSLQQSLAALVACDQAYSNGALTPGVTQLSYHSDYSGGNPVPATYVDQPAFVIPSGFLVEKVIDRSEVGAQAIIYKNIATNEIMVAFRGTDGPNAVDWVANTQSFGMKQWEALREPSPSNGADGLLTALDKINASGGQIHFTGQSLGGALAQYAAYAAGVRVDLFLTH